jgi:8-oxo-dGTP diphosphatase
VPFTPIVGTLGYVLSQDGTQVLLIHRNARPQDAHLGKWNGLGGKMDPGESVSACMTREIHEEAGLRVTRMVLRGTVSWPGFGKAGEDWLGFIFLVDAYEGEPLRENAEGTLAWKPIEDLLDGSLPLWEGDRHFLPLVFDGDQRPFHGVMPYADGKPTGWSYERW